jgi:hypothetical protein
MQPLRLFVLAWLGSGLGAVLGSILGNAAGPLGLKVGAALGGAGFLLATVALATRLGWLPPVERRGAFVGGLLGFAVAIPISLAHLDTPITPIMAAGLIGAGVLLGAGVARGWGRP